jgi:hypothetical protein
VKQSWGIIGIEIDPLLKYNPLTAQVILCSFFYIKMKQAIARDYNTLLCWENFKNNHCCTSFFSILRKELFLTKISSFYSLWVKTKNSIMERIKSPANI